MNIYHITFKREWINAQSIGEYRPANFKRDGFIHCSFKDQVIKVANSFYHSSNDLVLLKIDSDRVPSRIIEENLEGGDENFPHIYGTLPAHAVTAVADLSRDSSGNYVFPSQLDR
jgi:uncharacterized protein (DUF952 family)